MEFDWGVEFCKISEVCGFTPSYILNFTMPQFILYARYANEQKSYQSNLKNVNEYIESIFGAKENNRGIKRLSTPTIVECKNDFNNLINNWDNIEAAKKSLVEKTGKKTFTMDEIIKEINSLDKGRSLRYRFKDDK